MESKGLGYEREGLQLAKFFLDYCFNASDMLTMSDPATIIEALRDYAEGTGGICANCGGAMCDPHCPVSKYIVDMHKWLKGDRTTFAVDHSAPALPALPLLGEYPQHKNQETSNCIDCAAECCWAGSGKKAAKCEHFKDASTRQISNAEG